MQRVVVYQNQVFKNLLLPRLLSEVYIFVHLFQRDVELWVLGRLVFQRFDLLTSWKQLGQIIDNGVQLCLVCEPKVLQRWGNSGLEAVQVLNCFLDVFRKLRELLHVRKLLEDSHAVSV